MCDLLDHLLNSIEDVLSRISTSKLQAYNFTQNHLRALDVSTDQGYRKKYNGFYRVRFPNSKAYGVYFSLLEQNKNNKYVALESILEQLYEATGRIETSFGSKLLATVNPNVAPLDSVVLGHLNLHLPYNRNLPAKIRMQQCVNIHIRLMTEMDNLIGKPQFEELKTRFNSRFKGYNYTNVKILDLLLWRHRPNKKSLAQ